MWALMTGNLRAWRALLAVLLLAAAAVVLPVAAQSTTATEPLTWTLAPTPGETVTEETPEEIPDDETPDETGTPEETLAGIAEDATPELTLVENETPEETLAGITEDEAPELTLVENETPEETLTVTGNSTTNETSPPVVVGTDEATPAGTATTELPTFTPIQAAQINGSATQVAPLSLAGAILAALAAALVVVFRRNRR